MANLDDLFQKTITGQYLEMDTFTNGPLGAPINTQSLSVLDAPASSCTITADITQTWGGVTYSAGDIMFASDAYTIYDSLGNTMNNWTAGSTGAHRAAPQGVTFVRVPDVVVLANGGVATDKGRFFWGFFNSMKFGIKVGVIDMTGNSGRGKFVGYASLGADGTNTNGEVGTLLNTIEGTCGRMESICVLDGVTEEEQGVIILSKEFIGTGANNTWNMHKITKISNISTGTAPGCPLLSNVGSNGVIQTYGYPTAPNDAGKNGIVRSTRKPYMFAGSSFQKVKIATIFADSVGTASTPVNIAKCNIMHLDTVNLVLSDTTQFNVSQADNGPRIFPAPVNYPSRYFAKWLEWSHKSNANLGYLYMPNFNAAVPGGDLDINWQSFNSTNTNITNGSVSVHENGGGKIWGGMTSPGRVIAGIWADPSHENRMFIHTPEVTGLSTSLVENSDIFSSNYPEQWGTLAGNWGNIQHCILTNTDDPINTTLIQQMVGTLDNATQYRYGAPAHHYCMINANVVPTTRFIEACSFSHTYSIDSNLSLWESSYTAGTQTSMREITQFPTFTDLIDAAADAYTGQIWLYHGIGVALKYNHWNIDTNLLSNQTAVTSDAALLTYSDFVAFATPSITASTTVGSKDPRTDICMFTWFIARKAGGGANVDKYSIGKLDRNTDLVTTYNVALELDTSVALSSGVPTSMVVTDNVESTAAFVYFVVNKKVIKVDIVASTVTVLGAPNAGLPTNWTAISWDVTGLILRGWSGVAGSQSIYDINIITGVASSPIPAQTLPGNYPWAVTSNIAFAELHRQYWNLAPLSATDLDLPGLSTNLCKNNLVWTWTNTGNNSPIGCYKCIAVPSTTFHPYANMCPQQDINIIKADCRYCANPPVFDDCRGFIPCCYPLNNGGPVQMPGVSIDPNIIPGNVYSAQAGTNPPVCSTAIDIAPLFWMSMDNDFTIISIDDIIIGSTSVQTLVSPTNAATEDIAFDKHGNVLITNNGSDLVWGAALQGYSTTLDILTTTFPTPRALDTDYSLNNFIIGADNISGVATFTTYDHLTVFGSISINATVTNTTISVGNDISCDPSTGDWWLIGDVTGGTSSNDLIVIDNATGNHALQGNLTTILSLGVNDVVRGIEAVELIQALTTLYVVVSTPIAGTTDFFLNLYTVENTAQIGVAVALIEPLSGTNVWDNVPTGLAYNDVCQKWANNIQPNLVEFADCAVCLSSQQNASCCFKCTDCSDPTNFFYSNSATLLPYTTSANLIWRDGSDVCWETEVSQICISPIVATIAAGPFTNCNDCAVAAVECFKLTSCIDPADILYTNTTVDPAIVGFLGDTIQISGECFCRTVELETCPVAAVLYTYSTFLNCANCVYYLRIEDCVTGAITFVDYATSPTLWPYIGSTNAFNVIVGAVGLINCHTILIGCMGPGSFVYPSASIALGPYTDCNTCGNANLVCVQATWCCDPTVIITVYVTSGITAADNGLVVEADITISGVVYTGCWEILSTGINCGPATIMDIDVNAIATSTIGAGAVPTCGDCLNSPCNDPCVLLNPCDVTQPNITVSGGQGAAIGTDVVNFVGMSGCYYVCNANLTHGQNWFWGSGMGINFTGGVATLNLSGASNTTTAAASQTTNYCWRSSAVHCSHKNVTFGTVAYIPGDLMFYSDGKYIYDSTHTLMTDQTGTVLPGGTPLLAGGGGGGYLNTNSASQQCIVVPAPAGGKTSGVYNQYYLFYQTIKNGPLYSCIIDMTLNSGKGQVLTASKDNIVSATSCEALTSTNTQAITEEWFVYDLPAMTTCNDSANQYIRGYKIDAGGIGPAFMAVDLYAGANFFGSIPAGTGLDSMARCKLKVDYQNRQIGLLSMKGEYSNTTGCVTPPTNTIHLTTVYSIEMVNGTANGPGGQSEIGAAGTNSQIVSRYYSNFGAWMTDFEFSPSGESIWTILSDQDIVGFGMCCKLSRLNLIDAFTSGVANQNVMIYGSTQLCELPGEPLNSANTPGNGAHGWDMQLAPDGKIYCVLNQGNDTQSWTLPSGNQPNNTSLLVIEDPNMTTIPGPTYAALNLSAFDLGSRHIGTGLPTYLSASCACDSVNITSPVVSNTLISCSDPLCGPPQTGCYKLTECDCTGGTAFNSCSVNDPSTMPADMITYGKSWSAVCDSGVGQRWPDLVNAIQNLGTTASPGINQTVNFSFSFIQAASNLVSHMGNSVGPTVAVEQLAGATGSGPTCSSYNKTYVQTHAQWSAEIDSMFNEIKVLFEGMFNASCGYGANLTVNFTNLGYESAPATFGGVSMAPGNSVSFTDSNGVSNIGDFRVGMMDYGTIFCPCTQGCQMGVLAACLNAPLNSCVPGLTKSVPWAGTLLFDVNEDWRSDVMGQPVVGNSFSIKRVGIHEILHAFGFGHDFLTFGGVGPAGDCSVICTCPCYQGGVTCPGLNNCETFPGSGVIVPCCPGITPNPVALMSPYSTMNAFATDFPAGLLGPEGIYDRRATCGIYGEVSANYGCMDGTCLGGCNYVIEYSDDPVLAGYLGGVITWDNGDAAGERCWEVEWVTPIPPLAVLINPVVVVTGSALLTCADCITTGSSCYELILCQCNTTGGAPASIITNTDMSLYCGLLPSAQTVEIAAYPGVCYEINCTPFICNPPPMPVAVVVTTTFLNCQDCCTVSSTCYELCPCSGVVSGGGNPNQDCSAKTHVTPGSQYDASTFPDYVSTPANGLTSTDYRTLKFESNQTNLTPCNNDITQNCGGTGTMGSGEFATGSWFIMTDWGGQAAGYSAIYYYTWDSLLVEAIANGHALAGMNRTQVSTYGPFIAASTSTGLSLGSDVDPCCCSGVACTTVTTDLSGEVGQVITLGPGPPAPLVEDECYTVSVCGLCNQAGGACTPLGAVTIATGPFADCNDCTIVQTCDCYLLRDCSNPALIINNVCTSTDLDTHFLNGDIIQINGNTVNCYTIECGTQCNPAMCITVSVTNDFSSCALCLGAQMWECDPLGGCGCTPSAGGGYTSEGLCLASPGCCPPVIEYECEALTCNCVPCLTGSCPAYNIGPTSADNLAACLADTTGCCTNTPVTYDCNYDVSSNAFSCADPGNGTGYFTGATALADCNACVSSNCPQCQVESWNCITTLGVSTCVDPGTGAGVFNNTNGGLAACISCTGCPLDPSCVGTSVSFDCDPVYGCIQNWFGTGQYPDIATCATSCPSYDPGPGDFEGDCVNCFTELEMKSLLEKVADICDECDVPYGLTEQEVSCEPDSCFGDSNIYFMIDVTSTFGGTLVTKLQGILDFKINVLEPAFQQLQADNPGYGGHMYIVLGAYATALYGNCTNINNTGGNAPGSVQAAEQWLQWAQYPLSGNAGANGVGANPMTVGTLPAAQRVILAHTQVDGIAGAPFNCNGGAWDPLTHGVLLEQILVLPGSYVTDGFTQKNPWMDVPAKAGFSDPYHEFEGGDTSSVVIIFQDESTIAYMSAKASTPPSTNQDANPTGTCGNPLWGNVPATSWNSMGMKTGNILTDFWKTDYHNYMALHQYGWDVNGVSNALSGSYNVTQKVFMYAGSYVAPGASNTYHPHRYDFHYHLYAAIGGDKGTVSTQGHISCADYVPVPAIFAHQCYAVTDVTISNPYMGNLGAGDPTLVTGYMGGSLSEYDFRFFIPDFEIQQLESNDLLILMETYLSDCE